MVKNWKISISKFCKKGNVHRFWITCAIKAIDPSLGRHLIVDFKNRQFVDLRAFNFVDVTIFSIKFQPCDQRYDVTGLWGHMRAKFFYQNISE